jgi:hypothetical protein
MSASFWHVTNLDRQNHHPVNQQLRVGILAVARYVTVEATFEDVYFDTTMQA